MSYPPPGPPYYGAPYWPPPPMHGPPPPMHPPPYGPPMYEGVPPPPMYPYYVPAMMPMPDQATYITNHIYPGHNYQPEPQPVQPVAGQQAITEREVEVAQLSGEFEWVPTTSTMANTLVGRAVEAGHEGWDGSPLWVIRAKHNGELIPGKLSVRHNSASIAYRGKEVPVQNIEVLCSKPDGLRWVPAQNGEVPPGAIPGGQSSAEQLYIGRGRYQLSLTPGKVQPSQSACFISFGGQEVALGMPVAGVLMSYSRGCDAVIGLMSDAAGGGGGAPASAPRSPTDSASDGYHSDSDEHSAQQSDRSALVSRYAATWARAADEALPALAALEPLRAAPNLKYKIVFSVVVLSFRAAISLRDRRLAEVRALLGCPAAGPGDVTARQGSDVTNRQGSDVTARQGSDVTRLHAACVRTLQETAATFPLGEAERTVVHQVLTTLREYPCLSSCAELHSLVAACCRAAWAVSLHSPPLRIDTDFTPVVMSPERHVRYTGADRERRSDLIKSFVWPALMDGGRCVFRAVVLT